MTSNCIHSDARVTVRVSARRFEQSPFQDRWATPETVMGVYAGRYYSVFNGEDVEATYWALRRRAVLYDVPERPVEITGPDAERFLEFIFARRIGDLKEGRGRYALVCSHQGRLFMDGVLFRLGERRFWYVQPEGALETWLLAHSAGFDVAVTDPEIVGAADSGTRLAGHPRGGVGRGDRRADGLFPRALRQDRRAGRLRLAHRVDRRAGLRNLHPGRCDGLRRALGSPHGGGPAAWHDLREHRVDGDPAHRGGHPRQRDRLRFVDDAVRSGSRRLRRSREGRFHRPRGTGWVPTAGSACSA